MKHSFVCSFTPPVRNLRHVLRGGTADGCSTEDSGWEKDTHETYDCVIWFKPFDNDQRNL